ncbi:MAG TPA: hypothetical protein DHV28_01935 [Ignavibacteriales bacterium]|nr:hypothetical protein [Ignavibacteriales bacterium]
MSNSDKNILKLNNKSNAKKELVNRIKEIQDLPSEVIIKFIEAAGSLSSTNFANRISNGHQQNS